MAIMGLLNPKSDLLYDPIRKKWVDKTPEEMIRQSLIHEMVENLGYPPTWIAVEKELSQLPVPAPLPKGQRIPKRRADLVVFTKNALTGSLRALMMVECKAVPLTPKFARQVIGYNAFVGADFIVLANETQILTGYFDPNAHIYQFEPGLPRFDALVK